MRTVLIFTTLFVASFTLAQTTQLNVMPLPLNVQPGAGRLQIDQSFSVSISGHRDTQLERGVERFIAQLSHDTGMRLMSRGNGKSAATLLVYAEGGSEAVENLGEDESYE